MTYHIFHDSTSHSNEDLHDRHGEEHVMEIPAPKMVQVTLRRAGT